MPTITDDRLYYEVDDLAIGIDGKKEPAGLVVGGISYLLGGVSGMTEDELTKAVSAFSGFAPERLHRITREKYVELYDDPDDCDDDDDDDDEDFDDE